MKINLEKTKKKYLTFFFRYIIIANVSDESQICGGVAQLARANGSYPLGRWFEPTRRYHFWPVGQAVKTPPFHGGNTSSNLVRVTIWEHSSAGRASALQAEGHRFEPYCSHQKERDCVPFFIYTKSLCIHKRMCMQRPFLLYRNLRSFSRATFVSLKFS